MFERDWEGTGDFLPPDAYEPAALASWATHDLPTWQGWRQARDIDWRVQLGEVADEATARSDRQAEIARFGAVAGHDLTAMHGFLGAVASNLVAIQGEDLCGAVEQANLPGTVYEHPNWCRRLPVQMSDLLKSPALRQTAAMMHTAGRNG